MKSAEMGKIHDLLLSSTVLDWLAMQAVVNDFSRVANPAICFIDFVFPNHIQRIKSNDILDLTIELSEEDWDQCHSFAGGTLIVGSNDQIPHWLQEPTDGVLSSSTCLVSAPIADENGLTLGFFYAFFTMGAPNEITLEYQRALADKCSLMLQHWQFHKRQKEQTDRLWLALEKSCPGYVLLDSRNVIVGMGSVYQKSSPDMHNGSKFQDFFVWDNVRNDEELWGDHTQRKKLFFFHSLQHNQKFKCTAHMVNERLLLVLANPVVNSNHALADYNLTATDFSPQDYITDYVFLHATTLKSLEDTIRQNEEINFKNRELELSNADLMRSKALLERKIDERNDRVKRLSNFPEQNPNPVFEIDFKKQFLCFSNQAAKSAFGELLALPYHELLGALGLNHDLVANGLRLHVEFAVADVTFDADAFRVPNENTVRFYARNVSELQVAKNLLARQQKGIDQLLNVLEALNINRTEAMRTTHVEDVIREAAELLKRVK